MAPQASRRFHEAGVGSRTGLRLSAVARDQHGFEDLEAFYKASQAALDQGAQPDHGHEKDEDEDYDSFDETHFSHRSNAGVNGRKGQPASSSSLMDIQNSSAPSPHSLLRSSRQSAASSNSPRFKARPNITLADEDDDDLDLPNLSTGSRSFDLSAIAGDDNQSNQELQKSLSTLSAPAKGLSARQAGSATRPKAADKGKGKAFATISRAELLSDSEEDEILANLQKRLDSAYDDGQDAMSDDDIVSVQPSPARPRLGVPAPKPRSPAKSAANSAAKKRVQPVEEEISPPPQSSKSKPTASISQSQSQQSPRRKVAAKPSKSRPAETEPEPEPMYGLDYIDHPEYEMEHLPPQSLSPPPSQPAQPPKRKRGRPPKSGAAQEPTNDDPGRSTSRPSQKVKTNATNDNSGSAAAATSKRRKKPAGNEIVERVRSRPDVVATVFDENGVRRSTRQRFAPLEYWRGERIRYGRPSLPSVANMDGTGEDDFEEDPSMMHMRKRVPVLDVKEVIRVPRAPGEGTFSGTTNTRNRTTCVRRKVERKSEERTPRLESRTPDGEVGTWELSLDPTADTVHVEDGWDSKTTEMGLVMDDDQDDLTEVATCVVRTRNTIQPVSAANQQFKFEKLFNCGGVMATGVLQLGPGTRKPTKSSKDNSFVFCVIQGAVRATVHRKTFVVGPEGVFKVPSGNTYSLENVLRLLK
uniref:Related to inner kinetochore protein MIF2 n=1 Tax=Melanopsichium pennsylvanicum 4 TaxID=1398559 RepID=A0A077QXG4_9BASI|nr:related to inner kinetochore protein MIF2 [Melanopsichium pennsylvanicum 4]